MMTKNLPISEVKARLPELVTGVLEREMEEWVPEFFAEYPESAERWGITLLGGSPELPFMPRDPDGNTLPVP